MSKVNKYEKFGSRNFSPSGISSTDGEAEGDIMYYGSTSVVIGRVYVWTGDWVAADADLALHGSNILAFALGTGAANSVGMLLRGMVYLGNANGNSGSPLYLSTSAGLLSSSAPTAVGDVVRIVGYNIASTKIWFNPDNTSIILADA
tara:strand:+ start:1002 stop:1442 length:441 start_codon:yes stop_codon:yes gene_type:complete